VWWGVGGGGGGGGGFVGGGVGGVIALLEAGSRSEVKGMGSRRLLYVRDRRILTLAPFWEKQRRKRKRTQKASKGDFSVDDLLRTQESEGGESLSPKRQLLRDGALKKGPRKSARKKKKGGPVLPFSCYWVGSTKK